MTETNEKILAIDIGGTHIKVSILDDDGKFLKEYEVEKIPEPSSPAKVMAVIEDIAKRSPEYEKITASFQGTLKMGL